MSTDWGIGCRTCAAASVSGSRADYFTGEWNNVRDVDALMAICRLAPILVQIPAEADRHVQLRIDTWWQDDLGGLMSFLRKHAGHALAPMNEYGNFFDQCSKPVVCACCGHRGRCVLTEKHSGECSAKREVRA